MTLADELIAEGERLCRPSIHLRAGGRGPVAAVWRRNLQSLGRARTDAGHAAIYKSPEGTAYVRAWQARCPLYVGSVDAVLGGWHMLWPEDDEIARPARSLLVWTFRDAEPWIEVWKTDSGALESTERIT